MGLFTAGVIADDLILAPLFPIKPPDSSHARSKIKDDEALGLAILQLSCPQRRPSPTKYAKYNWKKRANAAKDKRNGLPL